MHLLNFFTLLVGSSVTTTSFKISAHNGVSGSDNTIRPIVLWHGMGDYYNSSSMSNVFDLITSIHPDIPIHSISLDEDYDKDQQYGLFGNLTDQIGDVCGQLYNNSLFEFDAIGFSQGGLFLRSLIESCDGIKVNNLVTFGSPHNGIYDLPLCDEGDWFCKRRNEFLKNQIYKPQVQSKSIQAQYFRDVYNYEEYLEKSQFIADLNNDRKLKNPIYANNLAKNLIGNFIMVMFTEDTTLVPKESSWFYDFDPITSQVLTFTETENYKLNLLGLQDLYQRDKIIFKQIQDQHMQINDQFLIQIVKEFTGGKLDNFNIGSQKI